MLVLRWFAVKFVWQVLHFVLFFVISLGRCCIFCEFLRHFAWQVWRFVRRKCSSRGIDAEVFLAFLHHFAYSSRCGTLCDSITLRVAGAALFCIIMCGRCGTDKAKAIRIFRPKRPRAPLLCCFGWQVWHFLQVSASFCEAGVALVATQVHFASQV